MARTDTHTHTHARAISKDYPSCGWVGEWGTERATKIPPIAFRLVYPGVRFLACVHMCGWLYFRTFDPTQTTTHTLYGSCDFKDHYPVRRVAGSVKGWGGGEWRGRRDVGLDPDIIRPLRLQKADEKRC